MAIEISTLSDIDPTLVDQSLAQVIERLQEAYPTLDLKRGVFHDTVALYHAVLSSGDRVNLRRYLAARSILAISKDPSLADPGVVDEVLSCWGLSRLPASTASGEVVVVLSASTGWTFAVGSRFVINGRSYYTQKIYTGEFDPALMTSPADRLMTQLSDGSWAFTIEVTAEAAGSAYKVAKDTVVTPMSVPLKFVRAYAASDFTGGVDAESNVDLLQRLQQGIAAQGFASTPANLAALLRGKTAFAAFQDMSLVGGGCPEMLRDRHSIFPISFGGRIDWYVRTQEKLVRQQLVKTASLVEIVDGARGRWQFSISRDDVPGFYEIRNVRRTDAHNVVGSFAVDREIRSLDFTGLNFVPDIVTQAEGAYTAYQTAVVNFTDTVTDTTKLAIGDKQDYAVEVAYLPQIADIQAMVSNFEERSRAADVLIKAPVPCFVQLNFTVYKRADEANPDLVAIAADLAHMINTVGFVGRIYASQVHEIVHARLSSTSSVGAIDIFGRIRRPDGAILYLRDSNVLCVQDDPQNMVTSRTVQFFADPADIGISVETGIPTPV